jgi:hypothetical protein
MGSSGSVVPEEYRERYKPHRNPNGKMSHSCADAVAKRLNGSTGEELAALASRLGIRAAWRRWGDRNFGMKRMNLGNMLRGMIRRGEITISDLH